MLDELSLLENKDALVKAVSILRKIEISRIRKGKSTQLRKLFEDNEGNLQSKVNLMLSLIKIPEIPRNGKVQPVTIRSSIPHKFVDSSTSVLLITRDVKSSHNIVRKDTEKTYNEYRDLLREHNALDLITQIMPLSELRMEKKDFESKRNLSSQFDIVLCDDIVLPVVGKLLGKAFYKKKKKPLKVDLKSKDLQREIKNALSKSCLHLNLQGASSMAQVGRMSQTDSEIAENILASIARWKKTLPGGWINVRSLHLKTGASKAIPLYLNSKSPNLVKSVVHPNYREEDDTVAEDYLDKPSGTSRLLAAVKRSGDITLFKETKKGRKEIVDPKMYEPNAKLRFDAPLNRIIRVKVLTKRAKMRRGKSLGRKGKDTKIGKKPATKQTKKGTVTKIGKKTGVKQNKKVSTIERPTANKQAKNDALNKMLKEAGIKLRKRTTNTKIGTKTGTQKTKATNGGKTFKAGPKVK